MGFRFRRSIRVFPGVRVNFGKRGASISVGRRGANVTFGDKGVRTTVGIPGTGMSYTEHTRYDEMRGSDREIPTGLALIVVLAVVAFAVYSC